MVDRLKYLLFTAFCIFVLLYSNLNLSAGNRPESTSPGIAKAIEDTLKIRTLFNAGHSFIDGPSDSLIHYYSLALDLIDSNIRSLEKNNLGTNSPLYLNYQKYQYRALLEIGIEKFFQGKYSEAQDYNFKALGIADRLKSIGMQSEVYGAIGIVYKNQGEYPKALEYYELALNTAFAMGDTSWIAACYANAGNVYRRLTNYTKALDYYLKAQQVFERSGEKRRIAIGLMNIGNLYEDQKDFNTALEYYSRALKLSRETGDQKRIAECLMNVGNVYCARGNMETARDYYEQSRTIYENAGYQNALDDCLRYIGNTYEDEGNFEKAIEYYNLSLAIVATEDDKATRSEIMGNLANIYIQKNDFRHALTYASRCLDIASGTGDLHGTRNAYKYLSETWEGLNNPAKSLFYHKLFSSYNDSIFNTEKYRSIKDLEMKYETEKKEQQLELLTQKNQVQKLKFSRRNRLFIASLIIAGLIILMIYILFRNRQLRTRQKAAELEQTLMRSQMNPHFIFNALIAIQSYIYKKDPVKAGDFLAKFADLIRITLENSREDFVSLEKELKMLNAYLELQNLRFEDKFDFEINTNGDIDPGKFLIPPMMAQPFIENAIEHGLRHKQEKGKLYIDFKKNNDKIECIVEDDGVGRLKARDLENTRKYKSMATGITQERLEILGKKLRQRFELHIEDLVDKSGRGIGTKVIFDIPYKKIEMGS